MIYNPVIISANIISVEGLHLSFGKEQVIHNFDMHIQQGSLACLNGPSGSGKSTLLHALLGFVKPQSGRISMFGYELNATNLPVIRSMTSYLPQEINLPFRTVKELLYFPFSFKANKIKKPAFHEIEEMMDQFGLDAGIADKQLQEVSGGQKQRLALISCILLKKQLLILDEPTSALDNDSIKRVVSSVKSNSDLTILSASHNEDWLAVCDQLIPINNHHP